MFILRKLTQLNFAKLEIENALIYRKKEEGEIERKRERKNIDIWHIRKLIINLIRV